MEKQYSDDSRPAADASCPPWVMLKSIGCKQDCIVEETQAAAAACTSTNLLFHVSLLLAAPPASSRFYYGWSDSASCQDDGEGKKIEELRVIAVHNDAVLLRVRSSYQRSWAYGATRELNVDYFLYETGTAMARPPSLLLLPRSYFPRQCDKERHRFTPNVRTMYPGETGLLRYGQDELLVAQMELPCHCKDKKYKPWDRAELCVLRAGQEWELKQAVPIVFDDEGEKGKMWRWETDAAVAVGDRYLCWIDYLLGVLLCDMLVDNSSLKLRYVGLPVLAPDEVTYFRHRHLTRNFRDLGDAGAGVVRFIHVEPRRLFTVTTWTLSLSMDEPLEWLKDGVIDCDDLWSLPAYEGLPLVPVEFPILSLDNADVIWIMVRERDYANLAYSRSIWMVEVDTRNKALLSIVPYSEASLLDSRVAVKLRC